MILQAIAEAVAQGARHALACEALGLDERTVQRWRRQGLQGGQDGRHGPHQCPAHALSAAEQARVLSVANSAPFRDASPKTIVPALADQGEYVASESTFYRILRQQGQMSHRGKARAPVPRVVSVHTASKPNQVWSWDITYLPSRVRGMFFFLYLVMDIFSRRIMGWAVHEVESSELASAMILAACAAAGIERGTLVLHSDNGAPMRGASMLSTLQWLGVMPSFSRPSVSDDNPFSEALFRTAKYGVMYPSSPFADVAAARAWSGRFVSWYNVEHLHSGIGYVTPQARHAGVDEAQLQRRRALYQQAQAQHPERWTGHVRPWERPGEVTLNGKRPRRSSASSSTIESAPSDPSPASGRSPQKAQARRTLSVPATPTITTNPKGGERLSP